MNQDLFWGLIIGIAGIVIGVITAYIFFKIGKVEKKPSYAIRNRTLIRDNVSKIEGLSITFNAKPVRNLIVSEITVWNSGREVIKRDDIETLNHLRISSNSEEGCFYDASIVDSSKKSNNCSVEIEPNNRNILISFDYLGYQEGFVIQVIHSFAESDTIELLGDIKGASQIHERIHNVFNYLPIKLRLMYYVALTISIFYFIEQFLELIKVIPNDYLIKNPVMGNSFSVIVYSILITYMLILRFKPSFKRTIPNKIEQTLIMKNVSNTLFSDYMRKK